MHLFIIALVAFSNLMCSHVSGLDEAHRAAYGRVAECNSVASHTDRPKDHPKATNLVCDTTKTFYSCIIKPFDSNSDSEILDFYRAYSLQNIFLLHKEHMCRDLPYQELQELVDKSGIMERENLPSVENDEYVQCEGEIRKKCDKETAELFAHHANDLTMMYDIIDCFAREAPSCDYPITRHWNTLQQALKKHLQEKHGLMGEILEHIKQ